MYTISHIAVPRMYEQLYRPFLCFSFLSFFIYFYSTQNTCMSNHTHFLCFFFLFLLRQVYDYLMVSITLTLHFCDPYHNHSPLSPPTTTTTDAIRVSVVIKGYVFLIYLL